MCVCVIFVLLSAKRMHKRMLCLLELDLNEVVNLLMCFIKQNQVRCWSHM